MAAALPGLKKKNTDVRGCVPNVLVDKAEHIRYNEAWLWPAVEFFAR